MPKYSYTQLHEVPKEGFTLIELLISVSMLLILLLFAVPSMEQQIKKRYREQFPEQLKELIEYARTQAIMRGHAVCLSPEKSNGSLWLKAVILKSNCSTRNKNIIRYLRLQPKTAVLQWRGFLKGNVIRVPASGFGKTMNGRFDYRVKAADPEFSSIIINRVGRVRRELVA